MVALSTCCPSARSIGTPASPVIGALGAFEPYAMGRYAAANGPAVANRRYDPGGSAVNSNCPCESVVAVRDRPMFIATAVVNVRGAPLIMTVVVCVDAPGGGGPAGGGRGGTGFRLMVPLRIGFPVSAATTRPRMTPVPTGSRRWTASRGGGPCANIVETASRTTVLTGIEPPVALERDEP